MKVLRLHQIGDLRLHDVPVPIPEEGYTLVRVTAVGICGSDLHYFSHGSIGSVDMVDPLVLGHEFAGVTPDGQHVAVDPAIPCLKCEYCLTGNPNLCPSVRFAGSFGVDGALQEFVSWPNRCLVPLPPGMSDNDGAMLESLGIGIHAVDLGKIRTGMTVGIFGCGPIGIMTLMVARAAGATEVLVTEPLSHRMEFALKLGAKEWKRGQHVHVAFECAGENDAVEDAIEAVKIGGRVVLVGIPAEERTSFSAATARRKGLTIKMTRRMKHTYERAIRLVESGAVDVRSLVTHCYPLSQFQEAFAVAERRDGLKVIINPSQER